MGSLNASRRSAGLVVNNRARAPRLRSCHRCSRGSQTGAIAVSPEVRCDRGRRSSRIVDVSFYSDQVLPRITNVVLSNREFGKVRRRVASGLSGEVLEVGFGSGLNVPYYPANTTKVFAVDPSTVGRKLAAKRLATSPVPVEFVGLDGEELPLETESVDHILITWTMCTIPVVEEALREMHRVLRRGGELHFAEHGRSPDPKVARRQDRLNPIQRLWAGGCNLNRPIGRLVEEAGFEMTRLENFYAKGPKATGYMFEGLATKS
jgi:SAM-dependent methyltransferase